MTASVALLNQYSGFLWPGDVSRQGTIGDNIDKIPPGISAPGGDSV